MQTIMPTKTDLFVDTSGWAYYLDRQAPLYPAVVALVRRVVVENRHLVTTNYILTELVALLSNRYHLPRYHLPRQQVIKAINALKTDTAVQIVHIDQSTDNEAWSLLESRLDKEWSMVDASSFVVMNRFGMTQALTTDHHFTQAGFIRLPLP